MKVISINVELPRTVQWKGKAVSTGIPGRTSQGFRAGHGDHAARRDYFKEQINEIGAHVQQPAERFGVTSSVHGCGCGMVNNKRRSADRGRLER